MDKTDLSKPPLQNETVYCGSVFTGETQQIFFYRGNKPLVIQIRLSWTTPEGSPQEWELETEYAIRLIQPHLDGLPFGDCNRVLLLRDRAGAWRTLPRPMSFPYLISAPWDLPRIDEDEVKITRFFTFEYFSGNWNGTPVDLFKPWHVWSWRLLENDINGYMLLRDFGFTYRLLGLLTRNGLVIGYITEPKRGRAVQWSDRSIVYSAIAALQRRGILCRGWDQQQVTITPSGVKFLNPSYFKYFPPGEEEKLIAEASDKHWGSLKEYFAALKRGEPPEQIFWNMNPTAFVVPRHATMQRLLDPGWATCAPDLIYTLHIRMNYGRAVGLRRHRLLNHQRDREESHTSQVPRNRRRESAESHPQTRRRLEHFVSAYETHHRPTPDEVASSREKYPSFTISAFLDAISVSRAQAAQDNESQAIATFSTSHSTNTGSSQQIYEKQRDTPQHMEYPATDDAWPFDLFGDPLVECAMPASPSALSSSSTLVSSPMSVTKTITLDLIDELL